jgi:predicted transcriptional regulator
MPPRISPSESLSRRERQIMDILYARGTATADDVVAAMPDPPTRTAIRTFLGILESKGLVQHAKLGRAFVYRPTAPAGQVGKSAFRRVVQTFFGGSLEKALAAHLTDPSATLTPAEYQGLLALIEKARKKGAGA